MNEHISDLNCREMCPYTKSHRDIAIRPCVKEVANSQKYCIDHIQLHFSKRNIKPVSLAVSGKKIEIINERKDRVGSVANGTAAINPIFSGYITKLNL